MRAVRHSTSRQVIDQRVDLGDITTSPDRHITTLSGIATPPFGSELPSGLSLRVEDRAELRAAGRIGEL